MIKSNTIQDKEELKQCPNCGRMKTMFISLNFLPQNVINFINLFHTPQQIAYCEECGYPLFNKYRIQWKEEKGNLIIDLQIKQEAIPVITLHNPLTWDYDILEMITAQTTTGTGAITEIFAQVSDFMGTQSQRHNTKISVAENLCKTQLRDKAYSLGGNAVIACDVDISTAGLGNGLIIVCMSGTAIRVKNIEVLGDKAKKINEIEPIINRINEIEHNSF